MDDKYVIVIYSYNLDGQYDCAFVEKFDEGIFIGCNNPKKALKFDTKEQAKDWIKSRPNNYGADLIGFFLLTMWIKED